jgi:hypothetical protein
MQSIIKAATVLELSDGGNELFGRSWSVKEKNESPGTPVVAEITETEADSDEV